MIEADYFEERIKLATNIRVLAKEQKSLVEANVSNIQACCEEIFFESNDFSEVYNENMEAFKPVFGGKPEKISIFIRAFVMEGIKGDYRESFRMSDMTSFMFWYDFNQGCEAFPVYLTSGLSLLNGNLRGLINNSLSTSRERSIQLGVVNLTTADEIENLIDAEENMEMFVQSESQYAEDLLRADNSGISLAKDLQRFAKEDPGALINFCEGVFVPSFYRAGVDFFSGMYQRAYELTPEQVQK